MPADKTEQVDNLLNTLFRSNKVASSDLEKLQLLLAQGEQPSEEKLVFYLGFLAKPTCEDSLVASDAESSNRGFLIAKVLLQFPHSNMLDSLRAFLQHGSAATIDSLLSDINITFLYKAIFIKEFSQNERLSLLVHMAIFKINSFLLPALEENTALLFLEYKDLSKKILALHSKENLNVMLNSSSTELYIEIQFLFNTNRNFLLFALFHSFSGEQANNNLSQALAKSPNIAMFVLEKLTESHLTVSRAHLLQIAAEVVAQHARLNEKIKKWLTGWLNMHFYDDIYAGHVVYPQADDLSDSEKILLLEIFKENISSEPLQPKLLLTIAAMLENIGLVKTIIAIAPQEVKKFLDAIGEEVFLRDGFHAEMEEGFFEKKELKKGKTVLRPEIASVVQQRPSSPNSSGAKKKSTKYPFFPNTSCKSKRKEKREKFSPPLKLSIN